MLKILLKLTAKTLTLLCISAVFLFFSTLETRAAVGLSVGHNALNLLQTENLFYGNVGSGSHASSSFLLFQNNGSDRLRVDISGNLTTSGAITANAFSGPLTGQLNAANVSSGQFGANVGNGNFSFPGNVGIGTTAPGAKLEVSDSVNFGTGSIVYPRITLGNTSGAAIAPSILLRAGSSKYGWGIGAQNFVHDSLEFMRTTSLGGVSYNSPLMVLNSSGNLGVGTTAPDSRLHIVGTGQPLLHIQNSNGTDGITAGILFGVTNATDYQQAGIFFERLGGSAEGSLHFATKNGGAGNATKANARMTINASGNVGIGTTNPTARLYVNGTSIFNDVATFTQPVVVGAPVLDTHAATKNYVDSQISSSTGAIAFWGGSVGSNIWSLNSGNVGIGTTTPIEKLEIVGKARIGNNTISGENITFDGSTTAGMRVANANGYISLTPLNSSWAHIYTDRPRFIFNTEVQIIGGVLNAYNNTDLRLGTATGAEKMRITTTGNVGIGTTNPTAKLYVNGTSIFNDVATFTQPVVVGAPVLNTHAATKNYVDSQISSSTGAIALWGGAVGSNIWSLNSGNVGIGTTTPGSLLSLDGASTIAGGITFNRTNTGFFSGYTNEINASINGLTEFRLNASYLDLYDNTRLRLVNEAPSAVNPVFVPNGSDDDTGIGYAGTNTLSLIANGVNGLNVNGNGNVGIGTISPNSRLHVYNSAANAEIDIQSLVGAGNHWGLYNNLSDNSFRLWGGSDFMSVLRTSGNVGIGITNPSSQLYVYNDSGAAPVATFDSHYTSSSTFGGIDIFRSGTKAPGEGISYLFSALDNGGARQEYAGIAGQIEANTVNAEQGRMIFFTTDNGATRSEKVRITSNGRVGIGVTNPILALSVDGTSGLPASSGNNQVGSLRLGYAGGGNVLDFGVNVGGTTWLQATTKDDLSRYYSLVLNPNGGNVGIGTTNPTDEFYVNASSIFNDVATFTQPVIVGAPVLSGHAATKNYVDSQISSSTGAIAFWTGSLAGNINSANSGNVGIGTTTPTEKLHVVVSGNGHPTIESASASSYLTLLIKNSSQIWQLGFHGDSSNFRIRNGTTGVYPFVIATSSNIGIGTVSPNSRLHVYSASPNAEIDIQSLVGAGNHWGLYNNLSDNSFRLWGGSDHLTVLRGGNVGVGTSSPATKLDVWGNIYINSATHNNTTTLAFATNGSPYHQIFSNRQTGEFSIRAGVGGSGHYITFGSGDGSEKMRIATTGNVGIGTAAPGAKLHIFNATSTPYKALVLDNDSTVDGSGSIVHFVSSSDENVGAQIAGGRESTGGTSYLKFTNYLNGTGFVERMRISGSGNVGIGTTTPATRLTVIGSGNYSIDAGNYRIGNVATPVSALDAVNKSYLDSAVGAAQNAFWNLSGSNLFASSSSWNVGIGTSSPSTKLDVIGGLRITGPLQLSNVLYMGGGNRVLMVDNAGNVSATSTAPSASTVPVFVGITPSSYNGTSGGNPGYAYANSVCAAAFSGSHVCTTYEMLNTINASSTMPTADAWIHAGPPGYTVLANDCDGRRSASAAAYGVYWQMSDSSYAPHGRGLLMTCNNSLQYACCK